MYLIIFIMNFIPTIYNYPRKIQKGSGVSGVFVYSYKTLISGLQTTTLDISNTVFLSS